jgi:ABC-type transporter Mla MlaB component
MSGNTKTSSKESASVEEQSSLIGVDPLAWLSEEEKESLQNQNDENILAQKSSSSSKQEESPFLIELDSAITIRDVSELLEQLNNISPDKNELVFEASKVERVDTAALQLLSGFYLFAIDAGKKVIWNRPSEALCKAVELLGLTKVINMQSAPVEY